jgi:hypothetical protein
MEHQDTEEVHNKVHLCIFHLIAIPKPCAFGLLGYADKAKDRAAYGPQHRIEQGPS